MWARRRNDPNPYPNDECGYGDLVHASACVNGVGPIMLVATDCEVGGAPWLKGLRPRDRTMI